MQIDRHESYHAFLLEILNVSFTLFIPSPAPWFKILICPRLKSLENWVTYFKDMAKVACYARSLQSCPTPCNPMESSPPGSSLHDGTLQARIHEWVPFTSPADLPYPGIKSTSPVSPPRAGRFFATRVIWEAHLPIYSSRKLFQLHLSRKQLSLQKS